MALTAPPVGDRKRVKVYELKNNDWFDRGTGFCIGTLVNDEARIHVQSEDEPERMLLETRISKDDGYQKQQDTLIVWTDQNVTDMALSFQEAEGCASIWDFVNETQQRLGMTNGADDGLSDDLIDPNHGLSLPEPDMSNLADVEQTMRLAINTAPGREALTKYIITNDYVAKLCSLVSIAEDFESLEDLHRLCSIMKSIILLNDNTIMETVVKDDLVQGVVGALEYDPDFPAHRANHRKYLADSSRFKEVVRIQDVSVRQKIHYTYRLQYLKDVVLARILDDPTFSVLNSLIFFNQVEIVQHVQANPQFLKELFSIFTTPDHDARRKRDAVIFIQQCCSIAKSLQLNVRAGLFNHFIGGGLFLVITYALKHPESNIRVAGTEILIALIDHDALLMRSQIFKALQEKQKPLTDTLIELLLEELDLGVKAQMAEAIKILLDPIANAQSIASIDSIHRREIFTRIQNPGTDQFVQHFYDESAKKLFKPLKDLENRKSMRNLTVAEGQLYSHLIEILCFFIRQHSFRTKFFLISDGLPLRVAQLFQCPEKHLKLTALKFFRTCIAMHDPFHYRQIMQNGLIEPILDMLLLYMPKDNLLNSACLDFFEHIRREHAKELLQHVVETYRDKIEKLAYVDTFRHMLHRYEQLMLPVDELSFTTVETEQTPNRHPLVNGQRWQHLKDMDAEEEAYFNANENEDDEALSPSPAKLVPNGASPVKPLVDYPEDDDEDMELPGEETVKLNGDHAAEELPTAVQQTSRDETPPPPERIAEKRRRTEDDEDELGKLSSQPKRRTSFGSNASNASETSTTSEHTGPVLRRKRRLSLNREAAQKKIVISLPQKIKTASESRENEP